jgi:hypothetical protein
MTHPTDDEIMELAGAWFHTGENQKRDDGYYYRSLGTPSNVRGSDLIEFARALLAEQAKDAAEDAELLDRYGKIRGDLKASAYCVGNEYKPFHPSASHVRPEWRDGWNACYVAAIRAARAAERKA